LAIAAQKIAAKEFIATIDVISSFERSPLTIFAFSRLKNQQVVAYVQAVTSCPRVLAFDCFV
jgi:hypothetical protein